MAIKGLEPFIKKNPKEKIAKDINIRDEIKGWRKKHNTVPTIVIYLNHFIQILANMDKGSNDLILGGRYAIYNEKVKCFFNELTACGANLVFFCRPFLNDPKENLISKAFALVERKNLTKFRKIKAEIANFFFIWHLDKRFLYNLVNICADYGPVYTQLFGFYAKITEYASDPSNHVLAMIQHDTDFLLCDSNYQYWSLADLDFERLTTKKYCRDTLYRRLRLTTPECQLVAGISRVRSKGYITFLREKIQIRGKDNEIAFFKWAHYVKNLKIGSNGWNAGHLLQIIYDIYGNKYDCYEDNLEVLQQELSRYRQNENELDKVERNSYDFVKFCSENLYFAYGLIMEDVTTNQALAYIDLNKEDSLRYVDLAIAILLKQCGILLKDREIEARPQTRMIKIKRQIDENDKQRLGFEAKIIYPPMPLPSLENLIMREDVSSFDESRWSLFGWILELNEECISAIKSSIDSKYIRAVLFTLRLLRKHSFITIDEAEVILLTESDGQSKNRAAVFLPNSFRVKGSWIHTAHKYTVAFETVCHCLEICGLRKETDLIQFDAFEFHENMHQAEQSPNDFTGNLKQIQNIRLF
ncbi:uncharacterized protein LOC129569458 [Sitodiplosis mosellana]|uniref:uncharacterized protein LOC129569458 n=1 Tax=Sitodiplosis mosellana TaxID=263140 RepID=UPI00244479BC|nr:uncharacterized protein LOC129569458 [Sitodiplosis mosellana]